MLTGLSIRDIVLIDKLTLSFAPGLNVLTGETGAGKSILLDSLGLATGARADRALVRSGTEQGVVTASFTVSSSHAACAQLRELAIDDGAGDIILKRQITADGRSKAWINDEPVGQAGLAAVGALLVEVHGQHDDRGLLDAAAHRSLLDEFAKLGGLIGEVAGRFEAYKAALAEQERLEAQVAAAREDEDYIRHAVEELATLSPEVGEEEQLADRRALMMQGEKAVQDLAEFQQILGANEGVDATVRGVLRRLARLDGELSNLLTPVAEALDKAAEELSVADQELDRVLAGLQFDPGELERVEERLFEIRRLSRKHNCQPDDLVALQAQFIDKLDNIEGGDEALEAAKVKVSQAFDAYRTAAADLTKKRQRAAGLLDKSVNRELAPLKLEKATFRTLIEPLDESEWGPFGSERVVFEVKTNAGTDFGPMVKVASGGELARFILALKVVLAQGAEPTVMVFDEVDRGIGGATASAVGERLKRLADRSQVLVVTHSPQVAARGDTQFQISKKDANGSTHTTVVELSNDHRREEIARMLAGAEITEAARAAADQLLTAGTES